MSRMSKNELTSYEAGMPAMAPWAGQTVTVSLPSPCRAGFLMGSHEDAAPGAGHREDCKGAYVSRVMHAMVSPRAKVHGVH